jgi:hypothetical protein
MLCRAIEKILDRCPQNQQSERDGPKDQLQKNLRHRAPHAPTPILAAEKTAVAGAENNEQYDD